MNILGVDYGTKRIGLAWTQTGIDVVLPFGVISKSSRESMIKALAQLVREEKIDKVVFGLPVHLETGEETQNSQRVRDFALELSVEIAIPIEFADERLTSFEADEMGGSASRDEKAAMVILSSYLAEH